MVQIAEGRTLMRADRGSVLLVRENPEVSLLGKVFATFGGIAFLSAALLFWEMPVDSTGMGTDLARIVLCCGLALIGAMIGWSALYPRKSVSQIELDPEKRECRVGSVRIDSNGDAGEFRLKHVLQFALIKRFYAGSATSTDVQDEGGSTILYVDAQGGPRNGVTLVGSVQEIEALAHDLNAILTAPQEPGTATEQSQFAQGRRGFGRRGL